MIDMNAMLWSPPQQKSATFHDLNNTGPYIFKNYLLFYLKYLGVSHYPEDLVVDYNAQKQ